jgi:hypothetical protein
MVRLEGPSRMVDGLLQPTANDTSPNDQVKVAIIDLIEQSRPAFCDHAAWAFRRIACGD